MAFPNSSGSVERFWLASTESKSYQVVAPGGTPWEIDIHGDNSNNDPLVTPVTPVSAACKLQTSEDAVTWTDVTSVTVVPAGTASLSGKCGKYSRILNNGSGTAYIVAKPINRVQPIVSL